MKNPLAPLYAELHEAQAHKAETESVRLWDARLQQAKSSSTGPRTAEGKAVSCLNAVKTGLTGRTVLLPADDAELYAQHLAAYGNEYRPEGLRERELVQSLADTQWRLERIPGLEMAIYTRGRVQFESAFENFDPSLRPALIELETFRFYEKQLRNLQLQESRLQRRYEKEMAELRALQKERRQQQAGRRSQELTRAAKLYAAAQSENRPFDGSGLEFEFSTSEIEAHLRSLQAVNQTEPALQRAA